MIKGIFSFKCPNCGEGHLYKQPFKLSSAFEMNQRCPHCDQDFFPEPGFYYGAMFVGYIVTAFVFLISGLVLVFGLGLSVNMAITFILVFAAFTFVYFFRFARSLWIHLAIGPKSKND